MKCAAEEAASSILPGRTMTARNIEIILGGLADAVPTRAGVP